SEAAERLGFSTFHRVSLAIDADLHQGDRVLVQAVFQGSHDRSDFGSGLREDVNSPVFPFSFNFAPVLDQRLGDALGVALLIGRDANVLPQTHIHWSESPRRQPQT